MTLKLWDEFQTQHFTNRPTPLSRLNNRLLTPFHFKLPYNLPGLFDMADQVR